MRSKLRCHVISYDFMCSYSFSLNIASLKLKLVLKILYSISESPVVNYSRKLEVCICLFNDGMIKYVDCRILYPMDVKEEGREIMCSMKVEVCTQEKTKLKVKNVQSLEQERNVN